MAAYVSFLAPQSKEAASGARAVRVRESLAVPGTTTATVVENGEMVIVVNGEASPIFVAWGTTPDAAAAAATAATTAGLAVPAGQMSPPIIPAPGDKINVKAAS